METRRGVPRSSRALTKGYEHIFETCEWGPHAPAWSRKWAFTAVRALADTEAGRLPATSRAAGLACRRHLDIVMRYLQYDKFPATLQRLEPLARKAPELRNWAVSFLDWAGQPVQAMKLLERAGGDPREVRGRLEGLPGSTIEGLKLDLEAKVYWDTVTTLGCLAPEDNGPVNPQEIQKLLDLVARSDAYLRDGKNYTCFWKVVDQRLRGLPAARLRPLREAQHEAAAGLAERARQWADGGQLLQVFQRYPFARCLHEVMLELAERELTRGRANWAAAVYREVIHHTDDPMLNEQARTGFWLALAGGGGDRTALTTAFADTADSQRLPWRGATIAAGEFKRQLLTLPETSGRTGSVPLADLPRRRIELPGQWPGRQRNFDGPIGDRFGIRCPWPINRLDLGKRATIVTCPTAVARYAIGSHHPTWVATPPEVNPPPSDILGRTTCPDLNGFARRPVHVATSGMEGEDETVYCLLNTHAPPVVAALDSHSGQFLWLTANRKEWKDLLPLSQPAVSGGGVYVLACPNKIPERILRSEDLMVPIVQHLVCLDAVDGQMLWKHAIGWLPGTYLDFARGSARVTVHQDSIYLSTNAGILARCNIHDGTPQWLRVYPSGYCAMNYSREGAGPLVAGDAIVLAPRDHTGILAFQRQTGDLLWETPLAPSDKLVGVAGNVVVGLNAHWLAGLDLATGKELWIREFVQGTGSEAAIVGRNVVLVSAGRAYRLECTNGRTVEELDLKADWGAEFVIAPDGTLVEVVPPKLAPSAGPSTAGRMLALPLRKVWGVPCPGADFMVADGPEQTTTLAMLCGRRLAIVVNRPRWQVVWERALPESLHALSVVGNHVLTTNRWTTTSFDRLSGDLRWSTQLPVIPTDFDGDDQAIFTVGQGLVGIRGTDGKVLWSDLMQNTKRPNICYRRSSSGPGVVRFVGNRILPDVGLRYGETLLNVTSGRLEKFRAVKVLGVEGGTYDSDGLAWICTGFPCDRRPHAVGWGDDQDLALGWPRETTVPRPYQGIWARDGGIYLRHADFVFFDAAAKREIVYQIKPPDGNGAEPFLYDFRKVGDRLVTVYDDLGKIYVDVFEQATGRRIGRQELPGVPCDKDHETVKVKILPEAIVVRDIHGLHVFAGGRVSP